MYNIHKTQNAYYYQRVITIKDHKLFNVDKSEKTRTKFVHKNVIQGLITEDNRIVNFILKCQILFHEFSSRNFKKCPYVTFHDLWDQTAQNKKCISL